MCQEVKGLLSLAWTVLEVDEAIRVIGKETPKGLDDGKGVGLVWVNRSINCSSSCSKRISNDNNALDVKESGLNNTKSNSKTTLHLELWLVLQAPWITTPVLQVSRNGQLKQPACSWEESHLHQWRLQVLMDQRRPHDKVGQGSLRVHPLEWSQGWKETWSGKLSNNLHPGRISGWSESKCSVRLRSDASASRRGLLNRALC